MSLNRRHFLSLASASAAAAVVPVFAAPTLAPEDFTFLFVTDTHLQPELNGTLGVDMAMKHARTIPADFVIHGGDHIDDAPRNKAAFLQNYALYDKMQQDIGLKVHHTIGNHDCLDLNLPAGLPPADPLYGKKLYADHFGPTWYSFDHKGVHFLVLDSIGITEDHKLEPRIESEQLAWIAKDLTATPTGTPIVITCHVPLMTARGFKPVTPAQAALPQSFVNGPETIKLFEGHNVLAVLQGHIHMNQEVLWHGVRYITSGAVCGNWWKGTCFGTPEGFTVVSVAGGKLTTRYETYGFKSIAPNNT